MRHNLTAVFNNPIDAKHVLDELLIAGFPPSGTSLVSPPKVDEASRTPDAGHGSTLSQILARLFGRWHDEPERVDESAFLPGRHVITLTGAAELDSILAIGIMEHSNPVYIEDRHKQAESVVVGAASKQPANRTFRVKKRNVDYAGPWR
jgi:hypothetical protein